MVSTDGGLLSKPGAEKPIRTRSLKRFGFAFGPHRFRHSLATTQAYYGEVPGDASVILGHGVKVTLEHYNRAKAILASRRQADVIADLRRRTAALARQFYGKSLRYRRAAADR